MSIEHSVLSNFFIAILLILFCAQAFGMLFSKLHIPKVIGEIMGGLLLGPTCLGYFAPDFYQKIFFENGELLSIIYWLGLVLLMFCSGFEIDRKLDKRDVRTVVALVAGTTIIPFVSGWWITNFFDLQKLVGPANNILSLRLIIAVGIAVTSIPVISKIFFDLGIIKTDFARLVLATATVHDIILWVFVSIAAGLAVSSHIDVSSITVHVLTTVIFFAAALFLLPRLIRLAGKWQLKKWLNQYELSFIILTLLLFSAVASVLDVNLVFGAFLAGIVVNFVKDPKFEEARSHIKDFSFSFFVPVYFAIVGIKLDLIRHFDPWFFVTFLVFAVLVQTFSVMLTARALRYSWLSSWNLSVALNDRGGPCIVLATLAYDLGIVSADLFVTLILLAIITSLTAGSWLKFVLTKKWPLLETLKNN